MLAMTRYYPVVVFDLDGTLLRNSTVARLLAEHLGQDKAAAELDRALAAGEISSSALARRSAAWLARCTSSDVHAALKTGSWIAGIEETVQTLTRAGSHVLLATIGWRFAAEMLCERYGLVAVGGTELDSADGVLGARVTRSFDEHDKARSVQEWCAQLDLPMTEVAAIGDSRSDLPLFAAAACSVALNATPDARAAAAHVIDTEDLRDVLPLLTLRAQ